MMVAALWRPIATLPVLNEMPISPACISGGGATWWTRTRSTSNCSASRVSGLSKVISVKSSLNRRPPCAHTVVNIGTGLSPMSTMPY